MTTAALRKSIALALPDALKAPLRRWEQRWAPRKLGLTAAYHLGVLRWRRRRFAGLHLGCGDRVIEGFCNIDVRFSCRCDLVARVDQLKLADNTVGTIYCSHVFEHLPRADAEAVLRDWHRVLTPGGALYLACPDLEALCRLYLEHLPRYDDPATRELVNDAAAVMFGGHTHRFDQHTGGWSFPTLEALLRHAGFRQVRRFDPAGLPFRPFRDASFASRGGRLVSLNVEAVK